MADETFKTEAIPATPAQTAAAGDAQTRLSVSTAGMTAAYSNFFRVTATFEETVIDFGLLSGLMTQTGPEAAKITQRMVLSFPTAKRLMAALNMAISRHEQAFGVVEVDPQRRFRPTGGQPTR